MSDEYIAAVERVASKESALNRLQFMLDNNVPLDELELSATLREIGQEGVSVRQDINEETNLSLRALIAEQMGCVESSHDGWGNDLRFVLTNEGRAKLGLAPIPSGWERFRTLLHRLTGSRPAKTPEH